MKEQRIGLLHRRHGHSRNIHVRRTASRPHDGLSDVFGNKRLLPLVNLRRHSSVAAEAHQAEIRLHHTGIYARYAYRRSQNILTQTIIDRTLGCLGSAVDGAVWISDLARRGSEIDYMAI